jgi:hypothetical protein
VTITAVVRSADGAERTYTLPQAAPALKAQTVGMCNRQGKGGQPPGASIVVHVALADLAPTVGTFKASVLTDAIAAAKATGAVACSVALDGGASESADAMSTFGSLTLTDPQGVRPPTVTVKTWTPDYQAYAASINAQAAPIVEAEPFAREFIMWENGWEFTGEWPIRQASNATNRQQIIAAGFDYRLDQAAILANIDQAAELFPSTLVYSWMPMAYQTVLPDGSLDTTANRQAFNAQWLAKFWQVLGPRAVLGIDNADLKSYGPTRPYPYDVAYQYALLGMKRRDQTVTAAKMGGSSGCAQFFDTPNLAKMAADRVYAIEYPAGSGLSVAQMQAAQDYLATAAGGAQ